MYERIDRKFRIVPPCGRKKCFDKLMSEVITAELRQDQKIDRRDDLS